MKKTKKYIENSSPVCYANTEELREEFLDNPKKEEKPTATKRNKT